VTQPTVTRREFAKKWGNNATKVSAAAKEHLIDVRRMLGEPPSNDADQS
jgi:hypothetical protein